MRFSKFSGLCLVTLLGLVFTFQLAAQKAAKPPKMTNVQGTVENMDKTKMTLTVRNGTVRKNVSFSADTKWMYGHSKDNKPGSADAVKDNFYISCGGTTDSKMVLAAKECVYRENK
jgi:hypothetical protein